MGRYKSTGHKFYEQCSNIKEFFTIVFMLINTYIEIVREGFRQQKFKLVGAEPKITELNTVAANKCGGKLDFLQRSRK